MRAVLVTIADAANRDGEHAHPGMKAMTEGSLYSRRSVVRVLGRLQAEGWIEVEAWATGRGHAVTYRLSRMAEKVRQDGPLSDGETVPSDRESVPNGSRNGATPPPLTCDDENATVKNNGKSTTGSDSLFGSREFSSTHDDRVSKNGDGSGFDEWWVVYPRHEAKAKARAAFSKAAKTIPVEVLIAGAARYRADPNRDPAYTKHPTSWLNGGCWEDEPLPARNGNGNGNGQRTWMDDVADIQALNQGKRR
jgi:hypothetical protein